MRHYSCIRFEKYLTDCGFQVETERDFGITALRWAGMQAGIGIIRKNNFFYTEIVLSDYNWLRSVVQPKLWYIPKGKEWRYKTNALNAMLNNYEPRYLPVIEKACFDEYVEVRDMAKWVLGVLENKGVKA